MVNVMWFGSIVLCLAGSVFATLIQQSARRYQALTQGCPTPHQRARLRTFLFNGIEKFKVDQLHQLLGMSMHTSILLYCVGLLIYIFTIDTLLGYLALVYLLIFYLIYGVFTFTPIFFFDSPFGTPFTPLCWRIVHFCFFGTFSTLQSIVDRIHALSKAADGRSKTDDNRSKTAYNLSSRLKTWGKMLNTRVKMHRQWFLGGRQRSVEFYATVAPPSVDGNTLEWILATFLERDSEKDLKDFAAWTREYFHKYARSDPAKAISEESLTNPIFGFRLRHLLEKCIPENSGPTEDSEHKRRLRVGLECLWHWVWAYNQNSDPLPSYFPLEVFGHDMARRLQTQQDPIAGMIGRCFGALLEKKLDADPNSSHSSHSPTSDTNDLEACPPSAHIEVETSLTKIGLANIVSLTRSEMDTLATGNVPPEVLKTFRTTVDILARELTTPVEGSRPSPKLKLEASAAASFQEIHDQAQERLQAPDYQWLLDMLDQISKELSAISGAPPP